MIVSFLSDDKNIGTFDNQNMRCLMLKKPIIIALVLSSILAILFFTLPINLFDGVIVYKQGISTINVETQLSLSYFVGLGFDEADMTNVDTFYLTLKGKVMAVIFIFGFPSLLAVRMYSKRNLNS
jgi:hypothetical protein